MATGDALDHLMTGVDAYDDVPEVLYRIDAEQPRVEAAVALRELRIR